LPQNAVVVSTSAAGRTKARTPRAPGARGTARGTKKQKKRKQANESPAADALPETPEVSQPVPAAAVDSSAAPAQLSDLELIEGIRQASELHFNELYDRYFQRIYNFVYGRIRNHADSEEIVQETFTVVFSSIEKYSGRASLLSWIYGIAKNTTNNNLRQVKNSQTRMQEIGHDPFRPKKGLASCTPEEQVSMQRYLHDIASQLDDFGDWQVEIFEMRHLQDLSIREISERTQRSSDSVRSSLYRVKRLLMETAALDSPATPPL